MLSTLLRPQIISKADLLYSSVLLPKLFLRVLLAEGSFYQDHVNDPQGLYLLNFFQPII